MIITAEQRYSRETPTRLRLVADAVKKLSVKDAMVQLQFMNKQAARTMLKVFKQAVANAVNNLGLSRESLTIKEIIVGEGPHYKRFQAVSRGRAHSILKRTAHVRVVLESKEERVAKTAAKVEAKKEAKEATEQKVSLPKAAAPVLKKQTSTAQVKQVKTVSIRKTGER